MTELAWEGKYDKDGRKVAPLRVELPFQTIETVNESIQQRQRTLDLFSTGRQGEWRNRLIWGDKKYVLPALLADCAGKVDLIYIDPPFATGDDFSFTARIPAQDEPTDDDDEEGGGVFTKQPSLIEQKAYRDTWGVSADARARGATSLDTYMRWFYETIVFLRELLSPTGSIYVHLDWHVVHYARTVMDEVFGADRFLNDIIWQRTGAHNDPRRFGNVADNLLFYSKTDEYKWNVQRTAYTQEYINERFRSVEEGTGRRFWLNTMTAPAHGRPAKSAVFGGQRRNPPPGTMWRFTQENIAELEARGRIVVTQSGMPYIKQYLDESPGRPLQTIWTDIPMSKSGHERTGYATQKPEALLDRIVSTSSDEGDLVLDCFGGSGTTAVVAEKLGRRWIAADLGRFAIHTTRKRLLSVPDVRPFVVQNLGKYERQLWQAAEFGEDAQSRTAAYRRFIMALYKAKPIEGYSWLHGIKNGRLVHVGTVDSPVTVADVKQIASEFGRALGTGADAPTSKSVDVLGWDFAFEMNEVARQTANRAGIDVHFWRIPREVLDKRAAEQGDVRFFELAALSVDVSRRRKTVTLQLSDFVIPVDDVPEDVQRAITDWSQWIDYWAVDWDNRGDAFHNEWQTYRTRKVPTLDKSAVHEYEAPGTYHVVVKVIDILGNDTTKSLNVEVT